MIASSSTEFSIRVHHCNRWPPMLPTSADLLFEDAPLGDAVEQLIHLASAGQGQHSVTTLLLCHLYACHPACSAVSTHLHIKSNNMPATWWAKQQMVT